MYYLLIYYDEIENRRKVAFFNSYYDKLEELASIYSDSDHLIILLDEQQAEIYLNMPGSINF